jgi:MFS transporter, SP family, solute carrier family 2 (myo-inositol transporter), member 13
MMELLTPSWTFGLYAAICVVGWVAVWLTYPETMGLDLEDVGALLKDGWGVKESQERLKALQALDRQQSR